MTDKCGVTRYYEYDANDSITKVTYSDDTTEERLYNDFQQITRYKDRENRVTKYTYDTAGNRLTKEVGVLYNPATQQDVNQAEHAVYSWQYYGDNETVEGVLQPEGLLKAEIDPLGNTVRHVYKAFRIAKPMRKALSLIDTAFQFSIGIKAPLLVG